MPPFQPATRQNYENLQNLLNGNYGAYGESEFDRWIRAEGGAFLMPDGSVIGINDAQKTVFIAVDSTGKVVKATRSGTEYTALREQARRSGKKISAEEYKRRQEDAGRKYKSAATRVNDKLLYKTWKSRDGFTVEVTPSFLVFKYDKDTTVGGKKFKAGVRETIRNNDAAYKDVASRLNDDYSKGRLSVSKSETSADASLRRQTAKAKLPGKLLGKTWNDGTYTYEIGSDASVRVKDKVWTVGKGNYDTVARQLNIAQAEGKLKEGALRSSAELDSEGLKEMKADQQMSETGEKGTGEDAAPGASAVASSSSSASDEKVEIREGKGKGGGLMDSKYFWPAVGVGSLALVGGAYFLFFRNK